MSTEIETTDNETTENETKAPPVERKWPVVLALKTPVELGSERITVLEIRRGRLGDMKGLKLKEEVPVEDLLQLASRLSGRPLPVIERLDVDDAGEVMQLALDFYAASLGVGKKRSR